MRLHKTVGEVPMAMSIFKSVDMLIVDNLHYFPQYVETEKSQTLLRATAKCYANTQV